MEVYKSILFIILNNILPFEEKLLNVLWFVFSFFLQIRTCLWKRFEKLEKLVANNFFLLLWNCPIVYLSVYLFICLSVCLSVYHESVSALFEPKCQLPTPPVIDRSIGSLYYILYSIAFHSETEALWKSLLTTLPFSLAQKLSITLHFLLLSQIFPFAHLSSQRSIYNKKKGDK